jgi:plastocyanin
VLSTVLVGGAGSAVAVPAVTGPITTQADGCSPVLAAMVEPFEQHLKFAHLERSVEDQLKDIQAADQYVKTHTTLVQTMAAPVQEATGGVAGGTLDPFFIHLRFAHLERSVEDQLKDIQAADQYVKTHTVLVETMAAPATGLLGGCAAPVPAPQTPAPMPMPHETPGTAPAPTTSAAASQAGVMMMGTAFAPGTVEVATGGSVTWTNMDSVPHTVTGGPLQSSALNQSGTFSFTFGSPGTYDYFCAIHPDMKGAVVVSG